VRRSAAVTTSKTFQSARAEHRAVQEPATVRIDARVRAIWTDELRVSVNGHSRPACVTALS
jgi:hypothetical protein